MSAIPWQMPWASLKSWMLTSMVRRRQLRYTFIRFETSSGFSLPSAPGKKEGRGTHTVCVCVCVCVVGGRWRGRAEKGRESAKKRETS